MHPTRPVLALLVALLALAVSGPASAAAARPAACPGATVVPAAQSVAKGRAATLCLLNRERTSRGLKKLRANKSLQRAASRYASRMSRQDFFAHVAPDGSSMVDRIRSTAYLRSVKRWSVGENLAWGAGRRATPQQTVAAWMASPGHKRNVLDRRFAEIGVGIALGAPVKGHASAGTYVTNFGTRVR